MTVIYGGKYAEKSVMSWRLLLAGILGSDPYIYGNVSEVNPRAKI